jgi:hypothetical protein
VLNENSVQPIAAVIPPSEPRSPSSSRTCSSLVNEIRGCTRGQGSVVRRQISRAEHVPAENSVRPSKVSSNAHVTMLHALVIVKPQLNFDADVADSLRSSPPMTFSRTTVWISGRTYYSSFNREQTREVKCYGTRRITGLTGSNLPRTTDEDWPPENFLIKRSSAELRRLRIQAIL